jgi:hypothetical protein
MLGFGVQGLLLWHTQGNTSNVLGFRIWGCCCDTHKETSGAVQGPWLLSRLSCARPKCQHHLVSGVEVCTTPTSVNMSEPAHGDTYCTKYLRK